MLNILLVEDNPGDARLIKELLSDSSLSLGSLTTKVRLADALAELHGNTYSIILLDLSLPDSDGLETVRRILEHTLDTPIVVLTGNIDETQALQAVKIGAQDYLRKDEVTGPLLSHSIRYAIERLQVTKERQEHLELQKRMLVQTIEVMAMTIEKRDPYTAGHQKRVAHIASAIASEMGLSSNDIDGIYLSGLIHDLGKIYIPAEILSRPGRLSIEEMALVKTHAQVGYDIVKGVEFPWDVAGMILQHQERMDGSGYPQQLVGDSILPGARILAVADVIEAMASHRPYRPALGVEAALEEIELNRGKLYDPDVVDAALKLFREKDYSIGQ